MAAAIRAGHALREPGGDGCGQPVSCQQSGRGAGGCLVHLAGASTRHRYPAGSPAVGALPMTLPAEWIAAAAALALVLGLLLVLAGRGLRQRQGLGEGRTI